MKKINVLFFRFPTLKNTLLFYGWIVEKQTWVMKKKNKKKRVKKKKDEKTHKGL